VDCETGTVTDGWRIEARVGPAADLHAAWPSVVADPRTRAVAVCRPTAPAVVLGSTQSTDVVDASAAAAAGLDVLRRRSGGGAVLVLPGDPAWVDVWVPTGDERSSPDVTRAFGWLGETWARALRSLGLRDVAVQGAGPGACTRWSTLVCFGGIGAGEVTAGGRKVVGLSQRRNRHGAWFHGACLVHWDPDPLLAVLAVDAGERDAARAGLGDVSVGVADLPWPAAVSTAETGVTGATSGTGGSRTAEQVVRAFLDALERAGD
jgi:lipoate---protein ligase